MKWNLVDIFYIALLEIRVFQIRIKCDRAVLQYYWVTSNIYE
jgi:hypothetical protein